MGKKANEVPHSIKQDVGLLINSMDEINEILGTDKSNSIFDSMLSKFSDKEMKNFYEEENKRVQRVIDFIASASNEQNEKISKMVKPFTKKITNYIVKNGLEVNFFGQVIFEENYLKEFLPHKDWFTESQLKVIDALEKKMNIQMIEINEHDPKERFEFLKSKYNTTYEHYLRVEYQDGSKQEFKPKKLKR